ncbi:hypothetical protein KIN20_037308, partial [Parelaphostrongylus tenuis]
TYRIATWLGSIASSFVYYLLYMVHLFIVSVKNSYDGVNRVYHYFAPPAQSSTPHASPYIGSEAGHHAARNSKNEYLTRRTVSSDTKNSEQTASPMLAKYKSLFSTILYTPSRVILFLVFAGADLIRWMYTRRNRWILWLLPLLLLLVFFLYGTNDRMTILGHDVSELREKVSNYAHSLVDPEAVYAKSLNSIYDEYWRSGKLSSQSALWRITSVASNSFRFLVNGLGRTVGFIYTPVRDLLSFVLDFFATRGHEAYLLIPTMPRSPFRHLSFPNLSETLSTARISQYFPSVPDLTSWRSSGELVASAGQHLSKMFTPISNLGTMTMTGLKNLIFMLWNAVSVMFLVIAKSIQRVSDAVVDHQHAQFKPNPSVDLINRDVNPNVCVPSLASSIDEAKLVDKISAVVRAQMDHDFKIKFERELKALSATYDEKISQLELNKKQVDVDYSRLESIIRSAILEYDSDKTGMFDFALESAGASIISTRCSENYNTYSRLEKIWNIPLWYSSYGPRTVIQRNSKTLFSCYEHIGAHQAPGGQRPSAPKTFKIWAYKSENDLNTRVLLGDFMYDLEGSPLQFFVVKTQPDYPVKIVEMEVTSNYGAEYTSLYRLRVHGSLYKSGVSQ